jgi:hypothetical protein
MLMDSILMLDSQLIFLILSSNSVRVDLKHLMILSLERSLTMSDYQNIRDTTTLIKSQDQLNNFI